MTVGQLKEALNDPRLRDEHEVYIGNRGACAKCAIYETKVDSKPDRPRVLLVIPAEDGPYKVGHRGEEDIDGYDEEIG